MSYTPTTEQQAIIDAFAIKQDLVVEAGAGTGKTSTLRDCAEARPGARGVYLAYNKAIAADAASSFPTSVDCRTAHSFAYGAVGNQYRARLRGPRQPARESARILRIVEPLRINKDLAPLAPQQLARIVSATIGRFCYSADERIGRFHVPPLNGLDQPGDRAELAKYIVPVAQRAWDEEVVPVKGRLRFTHDCYLKLWAMSRPQLDADYVLLDEAQDANPVIAALVEDQRNCQRVLVGDRCQAIYGWRGAIDAMADFTGTRLWLSQSFRFGPAVAAEANKWLSILGAQLRLRGFDRIRSTVGELALPDAILCRTNAEAVRQASAAIASGRRVALVGGGDDIRKLAEAAIDLQAGRGTAHPELMAFTSWAEVQDYAENDTSGSDLQVAVRLIESLGAEKVIRILSNLIGEDRADLVISTAHKAKGREWDTIKIADDFREPKPDEDGRPGQVQRDDAMLAYVAVTRAQLQLDREGLAWVDRYVGSVAPRLAPVPPAVTGSIRVGNRTGASPAAVASPKPPRDAHCYRCGGAGPTCTCSPAEAAAWSNLTGQPAGRQMAGTR